MNIDALAETLNRRGRDLRRRGPLHRLQEAEVLILDGDEVVLVEGWLEALQRERALKGEISAARADMFLYKGDRKDFERFLRGEQISAEERDRRRYARGREAHRLRYQHKADPAPTDEELARQGAGREYRLREREVDKLVAEGMARHFARAAVFRTEDPLADPPPPGFAGCIAELEVIPGRPAKVGGIYQHPPECPCWICADDEEAAV